MDPNVVDRLREALGADAVSTTDVDRRAYARDLWPATTIAIREGDLGPMPDVVAWASSEEDVRKVLAIASDTGTPVIAYGGGSGVCGGTVAVQGGIILDMKRMDRVIALDAVSGTVTAQAGVMGERLERHLEEKGFTLGHFPSSIYCSTLGGWLATRSAGQLSTKYGKIEDMVLGIAAVLPDGRVLRTKAAPRSAAGPNWTQLLVGSEGTLGVITEATLRVCPLPEHRSFRGFLFRDVPTGLEAVRRTLQKGIRPSAVRLYDELDTFMVGKKGAALPEDDAGSAGREAGESWSHLVMRKAQRVAFAHPAAAGWLAKLLPKECLLLLTFEGPKEMAQVEERLAAAVCLGAGAKDVGPGPAEYWWEHRYKVSYGLSAIYEGGAFADTIEVATTWDRLVPLYDAMREAIGRHAVVLAHFSHAYPEGCSIYFTFAATAKGREASLALHRTIWDEAMTACLRVGATVTHHHGVGLARAKYMSEELGVGIDLFRALKGVIDPKGILNPGKMGL